MMRHEPANFQRQPAASVTGAGERVQHGDTPARIVAHVAGDQGQSMPLGSRKNVAVWMRGQLTALLQFGEHLAPCFGGGRIEGKDACAQGRFQFSEPFFQTLLSSPCRQPGNAPLKLGGDQRTGVARLLMLQEPAQHGPVRLGLGAFAQNIGVEQIAHTAAARSLKCSRVKTGSSAGQARSTASQPRPFLADTFVRVIRPSGAGSTCNVSPACSAKLSRTGFGMPMVPCLVRVVSTLPSKHAIASLSTPGPNRTPSRL